MSLLQSCFYHQCCMWILLSIHHSSNALYSVLQPHFPNHFKENMIHCKHTYQLLLMPLKFPIPSILNTSFSQHFLIKKYWKLVIQVFDSYSSLFYCPWNIIWQNCSGEKSLSWIIPHLPLGLYIKEDAAGIDPE